MEADEKAKERLALGLKYFFEEPRNVAAAAREFGRVTRLAPSWDEGYGWLSSALVEINQIDRAISSLREAMRLAPQDARYPISLGHIFLRRHDYSKAIRMFRRGLSLQPQSGAAEAHLFLAEAHIGMGDTEEACREWQFVLTLEPMYPSYEEPLKEANLMLKNTVAKSRNRDAASHDTS